MSQLFQHFVTRLAECWLCSMTVRERESSSSIVVVTGCCCPLITDNPTQEPVIISYLPSVAACIMTTTAAASSFVVSFKLLFSLIHTARHAKWKFYNSFSLPSFSFVVIKLFFHEVNLRLVRPTKTFGGFDQLFPAFFFQHRKSQISRFPVAYISTGTTKSNKKLSVILRSCNQPFPFFSVLVLDYVFFSSSGFFHSSLKGFCGSDFFLFS